jgi:peptidoglycan/LPS O-acetylase OafA/YrhL
MSRNLKAWSSNQSADQMTLSTIPIKNTAGPKLVTQTARAEQKALSSKNHFEALDGLRGVAAIAVLLKHSFEGLFPNGRLAVDLFFLLSGFVIAYSSDDQLQRGMPLSQFLIRRLIRLYPMILLGALLGIAVEMLRYSTDASYPFSLWQMTIYSFGTPLLLFFEFNLPLWSLFFELVANAFYGLLAKRLTTTILALVVVSGLIIIGMSGALKVLLLGWPRVAAGFFGGVLLYKYWKRGSLPQLNGNLIVLSVILVALFICPVEICGWLFLPAFAVMATIIMFGVGAKPNGLDKYCALLGQISYPLYALHWPSLVFFVWLARRFGLAAYYYSVVTVHCFIVLAIAYLAMRFYETPVRLYLTRKYVPSR